jgi:CNT family concentrative nucleoside transporter
VERLVSAAGLLGTVAVAWALSVNRRAVNWSLVVRGMFLQFALAFWILKTPWGEAVFDAARVGIQFVLDASLEGSKFVFGPLADQSLLEKFWGTEYGFIFFVHVTATIILVAALMGLFYYLGLMQWVIWAMAKVMQVVMRTSGSESLAAAANVFMGQTEAPLVIRPYLKGLTRSELMALMTGGMATIAGGVMAAYVGMLKPYFPDIAGHLLAASVMSAPAALVCAKIVVPETEESETMGQVKVAVERPGWNLLDAISRSASEGLRLALNVMAMLMAFLPLIYLADTLLAGLGNLFGLKGWGLIPLFRWLGYPVAVALGVPEADAGKVGWLLAERTITNEFIAYRDLAKLLEKGELQPRSAVIASYALCGFANFGSVAIQIGGIGALVPERTRELAALGLRAMTAGTLACFMTAAIAGVIL